MTKLFAIQIVELNEQGERVVEHTCNTVLSREQATDGGVIGFMIDFAANGGKPPEAEE